MFTSTNTRIVGLIAVVCAIIVAPQALAATSIHSRIAPPGDEPTGFNLGELKNGRALFTAATPDAAQGYDLSGFDLSDLNNIPGYQQQQEYLKGLALAALAGATTKSVRAATFVYTPTNPGWGAAATAAKKSAAASTLAVKTAPVVCNGQPEYDYIYSGCDG